MRVELVLTDEQVDAIAERVAVLLADRQAPAAAPSAPYMTVDEAAEVLRSKPQRVYDLLSAGRLSRVKDGSRVLVERAELDAYLRGVALPLPHGSRSRMGRGRAA